LELDAHNLTGSLPSSFGSSLTSLLEISFINNSLTGSIPSSFVFLQKLLYLDLYGNLLTGTIPSLFANLSCSLLGLQLEANFFHAIDKEAFDLHNVVSFQIGFNILKGTLPENVGNLTSCRLLTMIENRFTGTIPSTIGQLTSLISLDLSYNYFNGTLPSELGNCLNLSLIAINVNELTGVFPSSVFNIPRLKLLFAYQNAFFGSIPSTLGNATAIISLDFINNLFSSSIPSSIGGCKRLLTLYFAENSFTGVFPPSLTDIPPLNLLEMYSNFFFGNPGNVVVGIKRLVYLDIGFCSFTGSVPYSSNWTNLFLLEGNVNYFNGGIPSMFNHTFLNYVDFGDNYLTGTLPPALGSNRRLEYLNFSANLLSGSLPSEYSELLHLGQFSVYQNRLTGTIPTDYGNLFKIVIFSIYSNSFVGKIPLSLAQWKKLQFFFIQENNFSGDIEAALNVTAQASISNVDFSNNQFTGTLNPSYFQVYNLSSFAATSNCLHGTIPEEICNSVHLTGLSLDGLTTSINCQISIFPDPSTFNSFVVRRFLSGGIPWCLFSLPMIQSLHLGGNGFTGTIPSFLNISDSLQDLSLSHNVLYGTIPTEMQTKQWINLDLSYNKLSGTLTSDFFAVPDDGLLYLQLNRLSGDIPSQLLSAKTIQILDGNLFSCNDMETNLPHNDPEAETYSCGSNTVDRIIITWIVVSSLCFLVLLFMFCYFFKIPLLYAMVKRRFYEFFVLCQRWRNELRKLPDHNQSNHYVHDTANYNPYYNINNLSVFFRELRISFVIVGAFSIFVLIPLYYSISIYSNSYSDEYAWGISGRLTVSLLFFSASCCRAFFAFRLTLPVFYLPLLFFRSFFLSHCPICAFSLFFFLLVSTDLVFFNSL
jgi:Leucine-rich repeat (LRR) protein